MKRKNENFKQQMNSVDSSPSLYLPVSISAFHSGNLTEKTGKVNGRIIDLYFKMSYLHVRDNLFHLLVTVRCTLTEANTSHRLHINVSTCINQLHEINVAQFLFPLFRLHFLLKFTFFFKRNIKLEKELDKKKSGITAFQVITKSQLSFTLLKLFFVY